MKVTVKAFAKINLSLDINGRREDGYHKIDTVMQNISLFDTIILETTNDGIITVECAEIADSENICFRAAKLFNEKADVADGVKIKINKAIPIAAGLGGGSADAAAVLVSLNKIYGDKLSENELNELALQIGADVPFFLKGGTKRAGGVGEILENIDNSLNYALVLIKDGVKPSTKEMYNEFDLLKNEKTVFYTDLTVGSLKKKSLNDFYLSLGNDFEILWQNSEIKEDLKKCNAKAVCLSGSGPTVFGVFENLNEALSAAAKLREKYLQVYTAVPCKYSFEFE